MPRRRLAAPPWRPGILAQQRPAQALPQQPRAIEQHIHYHWHGVSAEDVVQMLASIQQGVTDRRTGDAPLQEED